MRPQSGSYPARRTYFHNDIFDGIAMFEMVADRSVPEWRMPPPADSHPILNLGAGNKRILGAISLDLPEWDADAQPIPYPDGGVKAIYAIHFLEHVRDPRALLRECQRVLIPGGLLNVGLPHGRSDSAYNDLDHKSNWGEDTWKTTFDNPYYDKEHDGWKFEIGFNLVMAVAYRNLMVVTQLIRTAD